METRHAIVHWDGHYCCPKCFRQIGSIFNMTGKPLPDTCPGCGQAINYTPEKDWDVYVEKNRLEKIFIRSHGYAH